jgi:hypothetical protein
VFCPAARAFGVSTDYILGLTTLSKPKSRDISELGLSEGAVTALTKPNADVKTLNLLLEHERWPYLLYLVKTYWDDSLYAGIQARNAVIDMATATLGDYMTERPEHRAEAQGDTRFLRSQKLGDHEAELTKLNGTFQSILRDIKQAMAEDKTMEAPATAQFMQTMREKIQTARAEGKSVTAEEVTAAMADMVRQTVPLDDKGLELFKKLAGRVLRGVGKS